MALKVVCDYCKKIISKDSERVRLEWLYKEGNISSYTVKDYHTDCFNYNFSCDIRKIKED